MAFLSLWFSWSDLAPRMCWWNNFNVHCITVWSKRFLLVLAISKDEWKQNKELLITQPSESSSLESWGQRIPCLTSYISCQWFDSRTHDGDIINCHNSVSRKLHVACLQAKRVTHPKDVIDTVNLTTFPRNQSLHEDRHCEESWEE